MKTRKATIKYIGKLKPMPYDFDESGDSARLQKALALLVLACGFLGSKHPLYGEVKRFLKECEK